jgi:ABC-type nitrate/sulfonate/bicarbonate transport system substrate-binding protein
LPKPELSAVRIAITAGGEVSSIGPIQASQLRIFEKYGLKSELIQFEATARGAAALQAGQVDISISEGGSALNSQLTDVPFVAVAVGATTLTDNLVCQSSIKTAADVKGKTVAIGGFGGPSHAAALLSLKALNLGATGAVITAVGGQSARIAAIQGGSVACGIVDKNLEADMVSQGFSIVASVWKPPVQPFPRTALLVTEDFLAKNPNTVLVALAAILEGQNLVWADPAGSAQQWAQWAQITVDRATALVKDYQTVGNRSLMWPAEAFTNAQKVIAAANPDIIDVKITDAFDQSLLQKLVDIGFYQKIGNPATTP